ARTIVFGEIGLAGEIRSVPLCDQRLAEAARLGFTRAVLPAQNAAQLAAATAGLERRSREDQDDRGERAALELVPVDRLVTALAQM
ncbi:MAG TPA: hypothetical protein VGD80_08815, partial [Kofleriaceae bacterium]